jgi:hypothetical protein
MKISRFGEYDTGQFFCTAEGGRSSLWNIKTDGILKRKQRWWKLQYRNSLNISYIRQKQALLKLAAIIHEHLGIG